MIVPVYRDYFEKTWVACCRCNECDAKWKTGHFTGKTKEEAIEKARAAACRRMPYKPDNLRRMAGTQKNGTAEICDSEFEEFSRNSRETMKKAMTERRKR